MTQLETTLFVGADIAFKSLQVYWQHATTGEVGSRSIKQQSAQYQHLIERLTQLASPEQIHVVMEATGTYWLRFALALHQATIKVSVINPQRAYHFAKSRLQRAKTDAIDAHLLCDFARLDPPDLWTPPPAVYHQLQQRLNLRQHFVDNRTQFRNRRHALQQDPFACDDILATLEAHIAYLSNEIKRLTSEIETLLTDDHEWHDAAEVLLTIPSISTLTAATILTTTHAFERCDTPEQAASFAGLVPHERSSGQWQGKRAIGGGHARLRSTLYMAAGSAIQHNPILKPFFERLVKRGKIKQVARCAVARKLLHIAWACVKRNTPFDPNYGQLAQAA